jgi:hypothetical protein
VDNTSIAPNASNSETMMMPRERLKTGTNRRTKLARPEMFNTSCIAIPRTINQITGTKFRLIHKAPVFSNLQFNFRPGIRDRQE